MTIVNGHVICSWRHATYTVRDITLLREKAESNSDLFNSGAPTAFHFDHCLKSKKLIQWGSIYNVATELKLDLHYGIWTTQNELHNTPLAMQYPTHQIASFFKTVTQCSTRLWCCTQTTLYKFVTKGAKEVLWYIRDYRPSPHVCSASAYYG